MSGGASDASLHPVVAALFAADPILAGEAGEDSRADTLGSVDAGAIADACAERRTALTRAEAAPMPTEGTADWLEQQVLLTHLRTAVAQDAHVRVWQRAPYWYAERIGSALSLVMDDAGGDLAGERVRGRLAEIPGYLQDARANLTEEAPELWAQMGESAAGGLGRFLAGGVTDYARTRLPEPLAAEVVSLAAGAAAAVAEYAEFCAGLAGRSRGTWVAGRELFDLLLRDFHRIDWDADALASWGRHRIDVEDNELINFARAVDPGRSWREQLDVIKDDHPDPGDFLLAYGAAMDDVARHTAGADLIGLPAGETCVMDWVPDYRREGLPLGVMEPSAPYAPGLHSQFLITPTDPGADPARRREHARDNNFVFITSIAGHETYPGHHVQAVHHKRGTGRGSMLRLFTSPQFVEGWGLYVEDLLEETGYFTDDRVRLVKRRNALWRALRVVIDVGLHTGTLPIDDAVRLLVDRAGMDRHMAAGEVRRYTRHDNPTYPSSYALGRDGLHRLRSRAKDRAGDAFRLRAFHDELLAHGSPPLSLLAAVLGEGS